MCFLWLQPIQGAGCLKSGPKLKAARPRKDTAGYSIWPPRGRAHGGFAMQNSWFPGLGKWEMSIKPMEIGFLDISNRAQPFLPSGNLLHSYWKWPLKVDFPIEKWWIFPISYVKLPEGNLEMGILGNVHQSIRKPSENLRVALYLIWQLKTQHL